jgi:Thioesterase-like superfamily
VAGQPLTGLQSRLIVADSANGISGVLPFDEWLFVPTALTVTLHRHPRGEWIFMRAETRLSNDGIGSCQAELADDQGSIGTASQPLVITRRSPA